MPIQLDDISTAPAVKSNTPKFFNAKLTGSGGAVGLLNKNVHPGRYPLGSNAGTTSIAAVSTFGKSSGSNVETLTVPLHPLATYSVDHNASRGLSYPAPIVGDRYEVTQHATTYDFDVFIDLTPQGLILTEDESGDQKVRDLSILYRMEVAVLAKGSTSERVTVVSNARYRTGGAFTQADEFAMMRFSYAPLDDIETLIREATQFIGKQNGMGVNVDTDGLAEWMAQYDVHERICRLADTWAGDDVAEIISRHIEDLFKNGTPDVTTLNNLAIQLRYLETYNVTLSAYRSIHAAINRAAPADIADSLSKQNLNLLMSHTLESLSTLKGNLAVPPAVPSNHAPSWTIPAHFSAQQRAAISTQEPLTLVQAGAGTGKSTVILGRVDQLISQGVDPQEIMVLSFTNAAADNILAKNPSVKSMTIARMIHDIYTLNHPKHELSSVDTIINSIDIYYPGNDMARAFRRIMLDVAKNTPGATTMLNAFIEKYHDQVISLLDRIGQTCLELEIILAYQEIDTMVEPPNVRARFLIIDEVQDNSIFEFIYLLKYVAKHRQNMYIVGDASQTLYEFRSSNPKALNALEESGVFSTFQLTTNYRSNQEILDFANVFLADIEANQAAGIRLQANSLVKPTVASFTEKVTLHYQLMQHVSKFRDNLAGYLAVHAGSYIRSRLAQGEAVAFLAHGRADVAIMEEKLREMFPNENVANLTSAKVYATTVFSQYIKLFWESVTNMDPADAAHVIAQGILNNLGQLTKNAVGATEPVTRMISDWWVTNSNEINGWLGLYQAGKLSKDDFFEQLRQNVLTYEIKHNGIKQSLMNQKNRERKEANLNANAKLIVSTIHGAKGLEFDNVVVVHRYDKEMKEDAKRMFYVAFTRAMKTEFVLSYGNSPKPRIEADYELIVDALTKREALDSLQAQGLINDSMSDDEVENALQLLLSASEPAGDDAAGDGSDEDATTPVAVPSLAQASANLDEALQSLTPEERAQLGGVGKPVADKTALASVA